MTGLFQFDGRAAVTWEAEGAGTVMIYRLASNRVLVQREWADDTETPDLPDAAEEFASVEFPSGDVIIMWAPVAWEDIWEPPAPGSGAQLSMPSMLNVGFKSLFRRGPTRLPPSELMTPTGVGLRSEPKCDLPHHRRQATEPP